MHVIAANDVHGGGNLQNEDRDHLRPPSDWSRILMSPLPPPLLLPINRRLILRAMICIERLPEFSHLVGARQYRQFAGIFNSSTAVTRIHMCPYEYLRYHRRSPQNKKNDSEYRKVTYIARYRVCASR